ncbi:MAG: zf-HC2 domain-containing protein [Gammaproteobacteria bacterium]|nr:zf-HC2 domain-containing protein [Gammaproteobacteria bacterium]
MLTCKEASRLISEGQERELALLERLGLRLHLWMCARCRRFEQQILLLRRALRRMTTESEMETQTPTLTPEARERIHKAIVEQDGHLH